jgi:hypothetical protein
MTRENLIQTRRGTAIEWATVNPTLANGESGFETDTLKLKIGDGVTAWNSLGYMTFDGGNLDENIVTGNTLGLITLSDYFDTTKPMVQYQGITGTTIKVPAGYDYAIYIDSQGNVTNESVNQGQTLTFKSSIVLGTSSGELWTCQSGDGNTPGCVKIAGRGILGGGNGFPSEAACWAECCREPGPIPGFGLYKPRSQSCSESCTTEQERCVRDFCNGGKAGIVCGFNDCCFDGKECVDGLCRVVCGDGFCFDEKVCVNDEECCAPEKVCGNYCCADGENCRNGICCPACGEDCCAYDEICHYGSTCCTSEKVCGFHCLAEGEICCDEIPCAAGETCCNGECCAGTCVDNECVTGSSSSSDYVPMLKKPTSISW